MRRRDNQKVRYFPVSDQILSKGDVVSVFVYRLGKSRAECSCGWDGRTRWLRASAVQDALRHTVSRRCGQRCQLDSPLVFTGEKVSLWEKLTPWPVAPLLLLLLIPAGLWLAPLVHASPTPGCETIAWPTLLNWAQKRTICDGPIRPDGSWERERIIGVPAHYRNASSSCYGGSYSSSCTFYPAGWVEQVTVEDTTYVVFPDNVLPGEPGHLA